MPAKWVIAMEVPILSQVCKARFSPAEYTLAFAAKLSPVQLSLQIYKVQQRGRTDVLSTATEAMGEAYYDRYRVQAGEFLPTLEDMESEFGETVFEDEDRVRKQRGMPPEVVQSADQSVFPPPLAYDEVQEAFEQSPLTARLLGLIVRGDSEQVYAKAAANTFDFSPDGGMVDDGLYHLDAPEPSKHRPAPPPRPQQSPF